MAKRARKLTDARSYLGRGLSLYAHELRWVQAREEGADLKLEMQHRLGMEFTGGTLTRSATDEHSEVADALSPGWPFSVEYTGAVNYPKGYIDWVKAHEPNYFEVVLMPPAPYPWKEIVPLYKVEAMNIAYALVWGALVMSQRRRLPSIPTEALRPHPLREQWMRGGEDSQARLVQIDALQERLIPTEHVQLTFDPKEYTAVLETAPVCPACGRRFFGFALRAAPNDLVHIHCAGFALPDQWWSR